MTDGPRPLPGDKPPTQSRGHNAYTRFLTGLARDVPRELRRSALVRKAIKNGVR